MEQLLSFLGLCQMDHLIKYVFWTYFPDTKALVIQECDFL